MLLSKSCEYGIRAALYVALQTGQRDFVPIRQIADDLGISFHFLTKILQQLTSKNLMVSFRGPKGGIALARPASEITLMELVVAIDGPGLFEQCVLGLPDCSDEKPCPLHQQWSELRAAISETFQTTLLDELAHATRDGNLRLTEVG